MEFRASLDRGEAAVPADLDVRLTLGNAATHKTRVVHDWLAERPRRRLHFTPTSASRLGLVECWFALLSRRRPAPGALTGVQELERAILACVAETDADPEPFVWNKPVDSVLANVARFCQRTSNPGH